jgi:hypothetical protein
MERLLRGNMEITEEEIRRLDESLRAYPGISPG